MPRNIIDYSYILTLIGLMIVPSFFSVEVAPFLLILFILLTVLKGENWHLFEENKILVVPFIVMVFIYVYYTLVSPDIRLSLKILERQISLLVVPIAIISYKWSNQRLLLLTKTYVYMMVLVFTIGIVKLVYFVIENNGWLAQITKDNISKFTYIQYKFPHLLNVHPSYWSYLILLALILVLHQIVSINNRNLKFFILWFALTANLWFLSSRTPILVYLVIHMLFFLTLKNKKSKTYYVYLFIFFIVAFSFLMYLPLLKGKVDLILEDERIIYWPQAIEIVKDNYFLLGEGLGQSGELIRNHIIEQGDSRERYLGYDLHNQFLRVYVDMGFLGFIISIGMLFSPIIFIFFHGKRLDFLTVSITLMFLLIMMTESLLFRLKGVLIFAITYTILLLFNKNYNSNIKA